MSVDPTIFREYDIRGVVDKELTEHAVERIGEAYGAWLRGAVGSAEEQRVAPAAGRGVASGGEKGSSKASKRVTVGQDCRDHSPRLARALIRGLTSTGLDVLDLGIVTTPMQYFSLFYFEADGGIQITGSHNPPEYNGLKLSNGKSSMHGAEIQALRAIIEGQRLTKVEAAGRVWAADVVGAYTKYCADNISLGKRPLRAVVDAGNGTAGPFAVPIIQQLGVDVVPLFCEMDATFPNHHPDPTVEKNLVDLIRTVKQERADVGLAYDGDADRLGVVDENGSILWGDQLMILFSRAVLKEKPGATIVAEVKCSKTLYDDIERHGGRGIMWKTGHSLIKNKMRLENAELAGEMSGHIFFKHRYFGFDDGIYASLRLLELLSRTERPLSRLLEDVPRTYTTPELRVDCPESLKFRLVSRVVEHFKEKGHDVIDVDGARITFADGWGLVRASNTQPILVLRFEAETEARLKEIRGYVEGELEKVRRTLAP